MKAGEFCYAYEPADVPGDDLQYHGNYAALELALAAAIEDIRKERDTVVRLEGVEPDEDCVKPQRILIGILRAPVAPEDLVDAAAVFEIVANHEDYTSEDDWFPWDGLDAKDPRREELTAEISKTIAAWMDKHAMRPTFFRLEDGIKEFTEAEAAATLEFGVQ